jgi:signal transduction histidine kinase
MVEEPENLVLQLLRRLDTKVDALGADMRSEMQSLRADVAADLLALEQRLDATEKRLASQIVGLRRAVVEYHSSAIGHGVLIHEFEERLRRLEQHLGLTSPEPH